MAVCDVLAGRRARFRPDGHLWSCVVALALSALMVGCAGHSDVAVPSLLDRSSADALPVALEGVDDVAVLTSISVVPITSIEPDSAAGLCLHEYAPREATGSAVVRVGVISESVTFREASGVAILGCSNSPGPREGDRRWCGGAYGQLYSGRLRDPRLSIVCATTSGTPVAFAWVEPDDDVRYVAVEQPEYTEVYEVAGGLPVRIFTVSGVDVENASATFDISEHDAEGRRLRDYELKAFVAG
jgi:hypothetical protein